LNTKDKSVLLPPVHT